MLAIPAIDIFNGKVARLLKGNFQEITYYDKSPLEYAQSFNSIGLEWLHIVDLAASVTGNISVGEQIKEIKFSTNLKIQFGGGIKNIFNAQESFDSGADRIVIGSISVTDKNEFEKICDKYGTEKIVVAADINDEMIYVKGWTEKSSVTLWNHLEYCTTVGIKYFLCTDISKDGTLKGPNIDLYRRILESFNKINLIASGGISCIDDMLKLNQSGVYGAVVGKAIYENKISLEELKQFAD
ncbi:MAG: 1-(5-phosphoribosyl)-5-[(5-phosphoribosylamino)methylideneamino]imidazole-4-carboxamide isomerase [Melioribacter sp.]|nr:1-(5-phosphoribosyl)-5-[(5-phosphoribosylamino)methylideneamino]imidazole-4-carboxamide isomerase [Melioribacter sp.]